MFNSCTVPEDMNQRGFIAKALRHCPIFAY